MSANRMLAGAVSLLLVASTLPAQITWGPELGLLMTTYTGSDADAAGAGNKMGLLAGVAVKQQKEGKKLFLQSGLAYAMRGAEFDVLGSTGTIKFNYIEIPALVGWTFPKEGSKMTPQIVGGANLGFKAGCTTEFGGSSSDCTDVSAMDVALNVGGGVDINSSNGNWVITALYHMGFMSIDNPPSGTAAKMNNGGFTVKLGWMMKKKAAM